MNNVQIFFTIIVPALIMGGIGYALGAIKDKRKSGFWLGAALGPIGLILIMFLVLTSKNKPAQVDLVKNNENESSRELPQTQGKVFAADLWTFFSIYLLLIVINGVLWACILLPYEDSMFFVNVAYGALFFPLSFLVFAITINVVVNKGRNKSFVKSYEILAIFAVNILCIMTIGIESCASDHNSYNFFELLLRISDQTSCDKSLLQTYADEATYFPQFSYFVLITIVFINLIKRAYKSSCDKLS